ncbi:MAG: DUF4417 domain-containing protein [Acutalibacteraceae bacterium]
MTIENFNYRTNEMFLRNQFEGEVKYGIPKIPKFDFKNGDLENLRLIGFDVVKSGKDEHFGRMVHFFLYDYKFECIWEKTDKYIDILKKYKAVLTPDFSMYIEMAGPLKIYNTFRNRWCGAYLASKGIHVIPTVCWGKEDTFDFCFEGIEKGSTVAVSTYMVSEHNNHSDQKELFMTGYNEMLRRIKPKNIICYNTPFPEMMGNIVSVDYNLSSWRHYQDDLPKENSKNYGIIIKKIGFILNEKGMGSAYGGKWQPKKEDDKRFIGEPRTTNVTQSPGKKGGYQRTTYIGNDGKGTKEIHFTDHNTPNAHSDPHTHIIIWNPDTGSPKLGPPINEILKSKSYKGVIHMNENVPDEKYFEEMRFKTIGDFKWAIQHGAEIEIEWNDKSYFINQPGGIININEDGHYLEAKKYKTADEALEYTINGQRLREIITKVKVWSRTI